MAETKKKSTVSKSTAKNSASKSSSANKSTTKAAAATKKTSTVKKAVPKSAPAKAVSKKDEKPSGAASVESSNSWMYISGALLLIIVILLGTVGYLLMGSSEDTTGADSTSGSDVVVGEGQIKLVVVEDPSCELCQVDFIVQTFEEAFSGVVTERVSVDDEKGAAFAKAVNAEFVPLYMFDSGITEIADWDKLVPAFEEVTVDGETYYMFKEEAEPRLFPAKVFTSAPEIPEGSVVVGDENAEVTIFEFTDFECPYCAIVEGNDELVSMFKQQSPAFEAPIPKVMEEYVEAGKVKIVFVNYPIAQLHPKARSAHLAAMCANEQGEFEEYSRMVWDGRSDWADSQTASFSNDERAEVYKGYAKELGLDETAFATCLDDEKFDSKVSADLMFGQSYGVMGTPSFIVGDTFFSGALSYDAFEEIIESQLTE